MTITTNKLAKAYLNPVEKDPIKQNSVARQILEVLSSYLQIGADMGATRATRLAAYDPDMNPTAGLVNEVVDIRGEVSAVSSSTANYEAAGLNVNITTIDPSDYSTPVHRDAVAVQFGALITGTDGGRAWAMNGGTVVDTAADGYAIGMELFVENHGTDQATLETSTSKYIMTPIAFNGMVTAGCWFRAGLGGSYRRVVYTTPDVLAAGGTFLELANKFAVDANGSIYKTGYFATATTALGLTDGLNSNINIGAATYYRATGMSTDFSLGGFIPQAADGDHITIYNATTGHMTIANESTGSSAANRIKTLTGANVVLRAGTSAASFVYDATDTRWILVSSN